MKSYRDRLNFYKKNLTFDYALHYSFLIYQLSWSDVYWLDLLNINLFFERCPGLHTIVSLDGFIVLNSIETTTSLEAIPALTKSLTPSS